jgi:autotransporter-associated beta strand protein
MTLAAWAAAIFGVNAVGANAGTIYWEGGVNPWGVVASWTTNPLAAGSDPASVPGAGDTIVMNVAGANGSTALRLEGPQSAFGIVIASTGNTNVRGGTTQTLASPVLSLGGGGISRPLSVTGTNDTTIGSVTVAGQPQDNVIVELTANQTWDNSGASAGGIIRADGPVRVSSAAIDTNRILTLTGTNSGLNQISAGAAAGLGDGSGSGNTLAVEKTGTGLWIISVPVATAISGTHTFSGGVTLTQGTLSVDGTSSTPTAGVVTSGPLGTGVLTMNGGTLLGSSSSAATTSTTNTLANNVTLNAAAGSTFRVVNGTTGTSVTTLSGVLGGVSGGFTKTGNGVRVLTNDNTYSGNTVVEAGGLTGAVNLLNASSTNNIPNSPVITVDGILDVTGLQSGTIALGLSQTIKGTGFVNGTIGGAGSVQPGASPGILFAGATDPTGGLDYSIEMTAPDPVWSNNLASVNDVLRLTSPTTPFAAALDGDNTITVNFGMALSLGDVIRGGFFTDANSDFSSLVSSADWQFTFTGGSLPGGASIVTSVTQVASADFFSGTISNGWVTTFTIIPEPTSIVFAAIGVCAFGLVRSRCRRS